MTRSHALLLVLATLIWGGAARAQPRHAPRGPRVIHLDETHCFGRHTPPRPEWVVALPDACPGATLLRLCGAATPTTSCPSAAAAADQIGDDALDHCAVDPALLGPAGALYEDGETAGSVPRALRLYRLLEAAPDVREIALWRTSRAAYRMSHYAEALATLVLLLDAPSRPATMEAAEELYAAILVYDDWNEDGDPDPDYGVARFTAAHLPDAPWAYDVATRAMRMASELSSYVLVVDAGAEVRRRWPMHADENVVDSLVASALAGLARYDELAMHLAVAATRCRERHASCDTEFSGRALDLAIQRLAVCRARPDEDASVQACRAGVAEARAWLAEQSSPPPTLEADVADTDAWLGDVAAASWPRGRHVTREPPTALRTAPSAHAAMDDVVAILDPRVLVGRVDPTALRACAPRAGGAVAVRVAIAADGRVTGVTSSPPSDESSCVRGVLERTPPLPPSEDGSADVAGLVLFAPSARRPGGRDLASGYGPSTPPP